MKDKVLKSSVHELISHFDVDLIAILGLQSLDKVAMLGVNKTEFFVEEIYMKIQFSSQRREMLLFLSTNMAAVTSRANQQ